MATRTASGENGRGAAKKAAETAESRADLVLSDLRRVEHEASRRAEELAQARRDRECDAEVLAAARQALAEAEEKHARVCWRRARHRRRRSRI